MGDEKHPNEDYVHAERSRPPAGTALPPDVSATPPADEESEPKEKGGKNR